MRWKKSPCRTREEVLVIAFDPSWAEPDASLLEDRRGELPEFPIEVLPPSLSNWLLRASRGAGVRTDHIAVPLLGVTSSLIGMARRIQATTAWLEPMTLWTCVVAQSGDRKTPGLKVLLRGLDRIEKENSPQYQEAHRAHQMRAQVAKEEMKRWRKACAEAANASPSRERTCHRHTGLSEIAASKSTERNSLSLGRNGRWRFPSVIRTFSRSRSTPPMRSPR